MRTLKLQMQVSIDGFVAGPNGELDWMSGAWDENLLNSVIELTDSSSTILLGRKMTPGFVTYWEDVVHNHPESPEFTFAQKMVNMQKIVFSKTVKTMAGENVAVENGDVVNAVKSLKALPGKDIIVYGGAGFISSLIENNLIDELYLFINPVALGNGLQIFPARKKFKLDKSTSYSNGVVINKFLPE